ncbi:hypothetical protein ACN47E_003410 [Coniothyrium glycines]
MSELAFCKSFLSALDARPSKLSSDHIADARQYPAQGAYTLPRLPHPPHPQRPNAPSPPLSSTDPSAAASSSISVTLKPLKPSTPTIPLDAVNPLRTSVFDLKQHYATATALPPAKIKILYKKKPVADSKTVAEVLGDDAGGSEVEFGVMIMGGAVAGAGVGAGATGATSPVSVGTPVQSPPAVAPSEAEKGLSGGAGAAAVGPSGKEVVATEEFWGDLSNFVLQRIRDEAEGERLVGVFKSAWEQNK